MSDDKGDIDGSDWLASQFNPTEQVPQQQVPPAATPVAPAPAAQAPAAQQPFPQQLVPMTPPAAPVAPPRNTGGGFDWGLRPGGEAAVPSAPVQPAPALPTPAAPAPQPDPWAAVQPPQASVPPLVPPPPAATAPTLPYLPTTDEATKPLSWDEFAASQQPPAAAAPQAPWVDQPTEAYAVQPWQPAADVTSPAAPAPYPDDAEPTSAIDSLFGDQQFQAYEDVGVLKGVQSIPGPAGDDVPREPRAPLSSSQKALMGVAGGLIGVLILIGMFFLGQHIGAAQADAPTGKSTGTSTNVPTPAGSGGPAAPGVRAWSALQGGECIQPFSSAWADTFTVVACSEDHDAEMVFKGRLPDTEGSGYPTTAQFQTELTGLCSAPTAINYAAAKAVTDLQVSFSYPPSASKWLSGDRTYYCFVDRQSGGDLPADLAVAASTN